MHLAAGSGHVCGLDGTGGAWCWGDNGQGQLGDGTTTRPNGVVQVVGGHTFVDISTTGHATCGLDGYGAVFCWGDNYWGEIGDGSYDDVTTPTAVSTSVAFTRLATPSGTGEHMCGIDVSGRAHCWGWNFGGQLGDGALLKTPVPVPVVF